MDLGIILCVCLTRSFVFLGGVLALLVIYIAYVWNVYEVGMPYALILPELCQDSLGETIGKPKVYLRKL